METLLSLGCSVCLRPHSCLDSPRNPQKGWSSFPSCCSALSGLWYCTSCRSFWVLCSDSWIWRAAKIWIGGRLAELSEGQNSHSPHCSHQLVSQKLVLSLRHRLASRYEGVKSYSALQMRTMRRSECQGMGRWWDSRIQLLPICIIEVCYRL